MPRYRVTATRTYHSVHAAEIDIDAETEDDAIDDAEQRDCDGALPWCTEYTWDDGLEWKIKQIKE